eukprot:TRINITY_DN11043_c0_g1_i2.p1 TRINITY_DN11043_c0_g1~~TRINITY_DN11043_c0_g1_i2.p1  ORF type:complete len:274 (+),score=55.62 TRINITY_DN11043_c0_g1_i2:95-916(+)
MVPLMRFSTRATPMMMHSFRRRYCTAVGTGTGSTTSATATDILNMFGTNKFIDYEDVKMQLNISDSEVSTAVAELETLTGKERVFRYTRRGEWDYLVKGPDAVIESVLLSHGKPALLEKLKALEADIAKLRQDVASLETIKEECDKIAAKHPDLFANFGLVGMASLWGILFWMVFAESVFGAETFAFDWNLVEPITYFLGYTVIWFGVVFYYFTGQEYTYDNVRDMMEQRKKMKLYSSKGLNIDEYNTMKADLEKMEQAVSELTCIKESTATQ